LRVRLLSSGSLATFAAAASLTIIAIIDIDNHKHSGPDAVIVSGLRLPLNIGDTAFMKGFGIAVWAIVFVVNAILFRPPVAGFVS
jgi:hypothetical protein